MDTLIINVIWVVSYVVDLKIGCVMKRLIICTIICLLMGCQSNPLKKDQKPTPNVAKQFVAAYNAHDIPAMMALVHDDIKYMFISGDQVYTETNGKAHLSRYLVPFFENKPNALSRIKNSQTSGDFIQLLEEAVSVDDQGNERSQCSFSMYQLKQGLIINVWYFDAHKCD